MVWTPYAERRQLAVVHGSVRSKQGTHRTDIKKAEPDAVRADGEAGAPGPKETAHGRFQSCDSFLRHPAGGNLQDRGRRGEESHSREGVRTRQMVLQRGALPA